MGGGEAAYVIDFDAGWGLVFSQRFGFGAGMEVPWGTRGFQPDLAIPLASKEPAHYLRLDFGARAQGQAMCLVEAELWGTLPTGGSAEAR